MNFSFNAKRGLTVVQVEVTGSSSSAIVSLALDTWATGTLINQSRLMQMDYDPASQPDRLQITTGSGIEFVPRIRRSQIAVLGQARTAFPVLCHTLPPTAGVDGLLGLDFSRARTHRQFSHRPNQFQLEPTNRSTTGRCTEPPTTSIVGLSHSASSGR